MIKIDTSLKAEHLYICGNSGTGKSSTIKEKLERAPRVIAFDPDDEYSEIRGFIRCENANELLTAVKNHRLRTAKIAYVAEGKKAFEFFCDVAFLWADCFCIAEEIADVTTPAKAPPSWGRLIRRGRKRGILIAAVTQRPAEADKTILANAAYIRVHALGRDNDRKAIAAEIGVPVEEIAKLKPLDYLQFDRATLGVKKGRLGEKREKTIK
jgi:hypothetical protein